MKRVSVLMSVISILFSLVGCVSGSSSLSDKEIESEANDFAKTVINAIDEYDEKYFDSLFTDEALDSADFEKGKAYLLGIFEGEILSIEQFAVVCGGGYSKYGKSYTPTVCCDIITDKSEYALYIEYYLDGYNTSTGKHYSNRIMRLRLTIKSEMPETGGFTNHGGMGYHEGIYYPEIVLD